MTRRLVITALALTLACAALSAAAVPAVEAGLERVAEIVLRETGRRLQDVPVVCEHESTGDGKLLLLCTVCPRLRPGEVCR